MAESVARILLTADGRQAAAELTRMQVAIARLGDTATSVVGGFRTLGAVVGVSFGVDLLRRTIATADAYRTLEARIRGITAETGDYLKVSEDLREVSRLTGTQLETTVSVFQSLARSSKELGATNTQMVTLTKLVQQLGVIGGTSTAAMQDGLRQFSQALAGGIVRAEEFNSIVDSLPEVANAIAKGLGVGQGELRKMVVTGQLLSKDVFDILLSQAGEIEQRFAQMPVTAERGWIAFEQSATRILDSLNKKAAGLTDLIGRGLQGWANFLDPTQEQQLTDLYRRRQQLMSQQPTGPGGRPNPAYAQAQRELIDVERQINSLILERTKAQDEEAQAAEQGAKLTIAQKLAAKDAEAAVKSLQGAYDKLIGSIRSGQADASAGPKKDLAKSSVLDINALRDKARTALEQGDTKAAENFLKQAQAVNDYLLETGQVTKGYYQTQADLLLELAEAGRAILNKEKPEIALAIDEEASAQAAAHYLELSRQFWAQNPAYQPVIPVLEEGITSGNVTRGKDGRTVVSAAGFAAGGLIRGPGTGTSDSILARVSNKEFVVNARQTARFLPLLEAINRDRLQLPRFATGGLVGAAGPTATYQLSLNGKTLMASAPAGEAADFAAELRREVLRRGRR